MSAAFSWYWHTLRYLKPQQLVARVWFRLYKPAPSKNAPPQVRKINGEWVRPAAREPSLAQDMHFLFLGVHGSLADVGWDGPQRDKLWRYNQHYFDDLNAQGAADRAIWHQELLSRWVKDNPPVSGTGWESYPTSLRIVNWIKWSLAGNCLSAAGVHSLAVQARWLRSRLEWHLLGNHLFTNAKALIFAGLYFEGTEASDWLRCGCEILRRELPEQILADGGHFERSPLYHALTLEDLMDLKNLSRAYVNSDEIAHLLPVLEPSVLPMLRWLRTMCHPDGELSFFNDSAFGIAPTLSELGDYAARLGFDVGESRMPESSNFDSQISPKVTLLQPSGYIRVDASCASVLLDVALVGPDYQPGHAHADTLSFEFSAFGHRIFVNSGTSVYGIGNERLRQRGTAAHNTVIVDGKNSSEVWSGFRVARRARPVDLFIEESADRVGVSCAHTGYQQILSPPVTHAREWKIMPSELAIVDHLSPICSLDTQTANARYHLHPAIIVIPEDSPFRLTLRLPAGQEIQLSASAPLVSEPATWHPRFGVSEPTLCLVLPLDKGTATLRIRWKSS